MNNSHLNTSRLLLRPIELEDARDLYEYRSDKLANQYQGFIPNTLEDMRDFIRKTSNQIDIENTWFQFVILNRNTNRIIGDLGIHFLSQSSRQVEFGITINQECQKNGYAKEAMDEVFSFIFNVLKKHRIIASVDPRNINSIKLLERLNMRKEAHFIKSLFLNNEWVDDVVYAILRAEYEI